VDAKIVIVGDTSQSRHYELHLPAVIGRSRSTDVRLGNPLVSRQHCEVFEADGMLMVRDLGSLNGTFVGDTRIAEQAMPLNPGDQFSVGPVTFRAEYGRGGQPPGSATWSGSSPTFDAPVDDKPADVKNPPDRPKRRFSGPDDPTLRT
jgi:predicted component of type VI protein secretion system